MEKKRVSGLRWVEDGSPVYLHETEFVAAIPAIPLPVHCIAVYSVLPFIELCFLVPDMPSWVLVFSAQEHFFEFSALVSSA